MLIVSSILWQVNATAFVESIADNRNMGNQKNNKVTLA